MSSCSEPRRPRWSTLPEPVFYSVTDGRDDTLVADELLSFDAALSIARRTGGIAWAHGRYAPGRGFVRWEVARCD